MGVFTSLQGGRGDQPSVPFTVNQPLPRIQTEQVLVEILGIATALSSASDLHTLLHLILSKSRDLTSSDAGSIFLVERADKHRDPEAVDQLWFAVSQNDTVDARAALEGEDIEDKVHDIRFPLTQERLVGWCALTGEVLNIPDAYALDPNLPYRFDRTMDRTLDYRAVSILTLPMRTTTGEVVGVLQLINRRQGEATPIEPANAHALTRPYDSFDQTLIEALASQAAVCVERTQLFESQQQLIDSIIAILAGAIDAKSPYTGGHCERVPELATLLAEAAEAATDGPLADFRFETPKAWREFRIGAWLHDCGKVTTPEYVVDKATKLETNFNRIHEIRTRFEVLLRDAQIARLEGLLRGDDPAQLDQAYELRKQQLEADFTFIAESNLGGEFFGPESVERLKGIAAQTWQRHFDATIGLAWEEHERRVAAVPPGGEILPVEEPLLADRPWHRIPRREEDMPPDARYGFKMDMPEDLYNQGEIYNLSASRGTLTDEERYKINDHIIQTIIMLENLPFPRDLARVAEYAGGHHETMLGTGYPRRLTKEQLSIPARIMAIADIFEALTAADRPYKKAKTLSESVAILAGFRNRQHIDPDLFELFLRSGVYRVYAERFLKPEQIDEVDIEAYLERPVAQV